MGASFRPAVFKHSLRDDRQVSGIDGDAVSDVTNDRRFSAAARSMAELYDMQHDRAFTTKLTYASADERRAGWSLVHSTPVGRDLLRRREMVKTWMDATCGMFGRSPDFHEYYAHRLCLRGGRVRPPGQEIRENIWKYYLHCRENDVAMTHTLVNPQVDRSQARGEAGQGSRRQDRERNRCWHCYPRSAHGFDLCAYAHELLVMPSTYLANNDEAASLCFRLCGCGKRDRTAFHLSAIGQPHPCGVGDGLSALFAVSMRRTRWSSSITCWCPGSGCSSIAT